VLRPTQNPDVLVEISSVAVVDVTDDVIVDLTHDATPSRELGVPTSIRVWAQQARVGQRSTRRGFQTVGETIAMIATAMTVGALVGGAGGWLLALPMLLIALARIQNVTHEAAHRSVWKSNLANDLTLATIGVITFQPAPVYRSFHFGHHRYTRIEGKDPEGFYDRVGTRSRYIATVLGGGIVFMMQMWIGWIQVLIGRPPTYARKQTAQEEIRLWGTMTVAALIMTISVLTYFDATRFILLWWLTPVVVYQAGPYTIATLFEHLNAESNTNIINTSGTLHTNKFLRWLALNGNYHAAHHTIPSASWWRLREVDGVIQQWRDQNNHPTPAELQHSSIVKLHRQLWHSLKA
jgi:fatty acid desaturase